MVAWSLSIKKENINVEMKKKTLWKKMYFLLKLSSWEYLFISQVNFKTSNKVSMNVSNERVCFCNTPNISLGKWESFFLFLASQPSP